MHFESEYFSDDAAQQSLQAGVAQFGQGPDGLLLVCLEQLTAARRRVDRIENGAHILQRNIRCGSQPHALDESFGVPVGAFERQRQRERWPRLAQVRGRIEIFEIVPNLVGDAERLAETPDHFPHLVVGAGERGAQI